MQPFTLGHFARTGLHRASGPEVNWMSGAMIALYKPVKQAAEFFLTQQKYLQYMNKSHKNRASIQAKMNSKTFEHYFKK